MKRIRLPSVRWTQRQRATILVRPCRQNEISKRSFSSQVSPRAELTSTSEPDSQIDTTPNNTMPPMTRPTDTSVRKLRVVPASASYFTGKPVFTDDFLRLQKLLSYTQILPTVKPNEAPRRAWETFESYKSLAGNEPVRSSRYARMREILRRLNRIHPAFMPESVSNALREFSKDIDPHANQAKPILVDEIGRTRGVGRRKASSAQVWLVEGDGEVLVNGKSLATAFCRLHDRESIIWPLKATQRVDKYNVWALVKGGGSTGQAEAIMLGLTKALMAHEPLLKPFLRKAGVVARDTRRVERKKPGHVKARKMPTWVKR